ASDYRGWEDLYRTAWSWDSVARGTHLRANCFSACSWNVFVKDGIVWREEQADIYEREAPGLPDFGPRGCQKGCSYSSAMAAPERLTYPMERVGPRGSGRWRRISWEDAITKIADAIIDARQEGGPETVVYDNGTSNVDWGPSSVGEMRLFQLINATMLDGFAGTGDLAMGARQTWGTSFVDGTSDDWFRADTLIFWHCNPLSTRIPDAHFLTEARYSGTTVVTVAPDFSPSAIHASLWINPQTGTDAALALGVARAIIERGAVDEAYVREQTDLPFLVRDDNGRFLRQSDMSAGGKDDIFYVAEVGSGRVVEAPATQGSWSDSLALGDLVPALAGKFIAQTTTGNVAVRPVMERLRERLALYTPDYVAQVTGVGAATQSKLADLLAASRRTLIYASWGSCKTHHSDLMQRALILLSALRGQHGRTGSGVRFAAWLPFEGADALLPSGQPSWVQRQVLKFYTPPPRDMEKAIRAASPALSYTPSHLFLYVHGGLGEAWENGLRDPKLPRAPLEYLRDAMARGWLTPRPAPDKPPRVLITSGVNPLRRWPVPDVIERVLWPKLKLIVAVDPRLSTTGAKADLLLPAAGYYEKRGLKYAVALAPYVVAGDRAVAPRGESKPEWEIMGLLALELQKRARMRGLKDDMADIGDRFTENGRYGPGDDEAVIDTIVRGSSSTAGMDWAELRDKGGTRARSAGGWGITSGIGSDFEEQGSLAPSRIHVEGKHAWPTLTGRQQFYLDHQWFMEADEVLPCWKPVLGKGGAYPILLGGGHTRWSIHSIWRVTPLMLRLQRGEPSLWMSAEDAAARGVSDNDEVRVRNDRGSFRVRARVANSLPAGVAILYHAWEPYQFADWRSEMTVITAPLKPVHLVGDYGHLSYRVFESGPVHVPRHTPVEIERVEPPPPAA
ncbi:MAG: molybdopterin-dependent oxidoreductase, partial [Deltaproteobacteria bacterium]|nr:molybdopterin-dependent oxidoreductase [Deltaproteobacteria bacterium]